MHVYISCRLDFGWRVGHFNPPSGHKIRGETLIFGSCPHSQSPVLSCFGVNVTIVASSFVNSPHELPLLGLVDVSRGCWWSAGPYPYYGVGHPGHLEESWLNSHWGQSIYFNDVWASRDGRQWEQLSGSAPWCKRTSAAAAAFNSQVFASRHWEMVPGLGLQLGLNVYRHWDKPLRSSWDTSL